MKWYVVKTNPKCEERAVASISRAGFDVYCPSMKKEYRHHRSKRWVSRRFPVFVGYLFVAIPADRHRDFGFVRKCDGVKDFLGKGGGYGWLGFEERVIDIPASVVEAIRAAQTSGTFDQLRPVAERFKAGDRVKIDLDAMVEQEATIDEVGKGRAVVMLEMFGSRREVSVPVDALRPAA